MVFLGYIRDLSQCDAARWKRREIPVKRDRETGRPRVEDAWTLVDTDGCTYTLSFINGANRANYTLLGQPGTLKPWFLKHYPAKEVVKDMVIFEGTGYPDEFRILTPQQWLS